MKRKMKEGFVRKREMGFEREGRKSLREAGGEGNLISKSHLSLHLSTSVPLSHSQRQFPQDFHRAFLK